MVRFSRDSTNLEPRDIPVFDTAVLSAYFRFRERKQRQQRALKLEMPSSAGSCDSSSKSPQAGAAEKTPPLSQELDDKQDSTSSDASTQGPNEKGLQGRKGRQQEREYWIDLLQHSGSLGYRDYIHDYTHHDGEALYPLPSCCIKQRRRRVSTPPIAQDLCPCNLCSNGGDCLQCNDLVRCPGRWIDGRARSYRMSKLAESHTGGQPHDDQERTVTKHWDSFATIAAAEVVGMAVKGVILVLQWVEIGVQCIGILCGVEYTTGISQY